MKGCGKCYMWMRGLCCPLCGVWSDCLNVSGVAHAIMGSRVSRGSVETAHFSGGEMVCGTSTFRCDTTVLKRSTSNCVCDVRNEAVQHLDNSCSLQVLCRLVRQSVEWERWAAVSHCGLTSGEVGTQHGWSSSASHTSHSFMNTYCINSQPCSHPYMHSVVSQSVSPRGCRADEVEVAYYYQSDDSSLEQTSHTGIPLALRKWSCLVSNW